MRANRLIANQNGSTLVIVMFMLIGMIAIISIIVLIILNNFRSVISYRDAVYSYYAAESGVEQGLYYVQAARRDKTVSIVQTTATIDTLAETLVSNGASYDTTATVTNPTITSNLLAGETMQFDLFDEDFTSYSYVTIIPLADVHALAIDWTPNNCPSGVNSKIELSYSTWTQSQWNESLTNPTTQTKYVYSCTTATCSQQLGLIPGFLYTVRLKALECDATDLIMTALDSSLDKNNPIPTHQVVSITTEGYYNQSHQPVTATTLWRSPLTEYFDYVLFSEEAVVKTP